MTLLLFCVGPFIPYTITVMPTLIGSIGSGVATSRTFFTTEGGLLNSDSSDVYITSDVSLQFRRLHPVMCEL